MIKNGGVQHGIRSRTQMDNGRGIISNHFNDSTYICLLLFQFFDFGVVIILHEKGLKWEKIPGGTNVYIWLKTFHIIYNIIFHMDMYIQRFLKNAHPTYNAE